MVVGTIILNIKGVLYALQSNELSGYGILNLGKISGVGTTREITPTGWDKLSDLG